MDVELRSWLESVGVRSDGTRAFLACGGETKEVDYGERSLVVTISTRARDRQGDVVEPGGARLEAYLRNPVVLWGHDPSRPIAKSLWVKQRDERLIAKPQFARTPLAEEIFYLYREGFLRAWSIGFIPVKYEPAERAAATGRGGFRITEWELLEYSAVAVGANPEALTVAHYKGLLTHGPLLAELSLFKGAIPYSVHGELPTEPEDAPWDAAAETAQADVADLKVICGWYDSEQPEAKSSYKLPHHRARTHRVVWRGVSAAMGALLGARGGVDIPAGDRAKVYRHLRMHYEQFGKQPPEMTGGEGTNEESARRVKYYARDAERLPPASSASAAPPEPGHQDGKGVAGGAEIVLPEIAAEDLACLVGRRVRGAIRRLQGRIGDQP